MIFLLNKERVYQEFFELFSCQVARALGLPRSAVACSVDIAAGRLFPQLTLAGVPTDQKPVTNEIIRRVWDALAPQLPDRIAGCEECRDCS